MCPAPAHRRSPRSNSLTNSVVQRCWLLAHETRTVLSVSVLLFFLVFQFVAGRRFGHHNAVRPQRPRRSCFPTGGAGRREACPGDPQSWRRSGNCRGHLVGLNVVVAQRRCAAPRCSYRFLLSRLVEFRAGRRFGHRSRHRTDSRPGNRVAQRLDHYGVLTSSALKRFLDRTPSGRSTWDYAVG